MKQVSDKIVLARIKEIRTNKGLSQEYIANQIGLKQSGYNLIENGNNELSVKRLLQIAIAMDVDCVDLMSYPIKYIKEQDVDLKIEQIKRELEDKKEIILGYKKNEIHLNNDLNSAIRALQICENEKQKYIDNKAAKESNTNVLNL